MLRFFWLHCSQTFRFVKISGHSASETRITIYLQSALTLVCLFRAFPLDCKKKKQKAVGGRLVLSSLHTREGMKEFI